PRRAWEREVLAASLLLRRRRGRLRLGRGRGGRRRGVAEHLRGAERLFLRLLQGDGAEQALDRRLRLLRRGGHLAREQFGGTGPGARLERRLGRPLLPRTLLSLLGNLLRRLLGERDHLLGDHLLDARQLRQLGRLQERQIIIGKEALLDERLGHFLR